MREREEPPGQSQESVLERHASWIELFFDLVVVAGIGQLAHLLHGSPTWSDFGLYALLYLAFWTAWACFTMYGNVAGDRVRIPSMLIAMFGLAVMMAAVAGIHENHALAFAIAYVAVRLLASRVWHNGQIVVDWPIAQMSLGVVPWVISFWVEGDARLWLWAAGVTIDLLIMFVVSGSAVMEDAQEKLDRVIRIRGNRDRPIPELEALHSDRAHLAERLGLYVIIVLGEGVILVISAASELIWDSTIVSLAIGSFVLLAGMWSLSLLYGHAGVPHLRSGAFPARIDMALHCFTTGAIAVLVAGLGAATEHGAEHTPTSLRWLLCGSVAVYFGISATAGLFARSDRRWLLGWALPCTAIPIVMGLVGAHMSATWIIWVLVATVAWQNSYEYSQVRRTRSAAGHLR
ncbi:low temperature requirement protein A [Rhodococcus sp. IEGM 1379]|uniref:low temperature requirement protein A n=1 Tax=Rhodococcus sp. IEGM 1379 TaxID=3047086 RepID=UPI0024B6BF31|nr:low temperature requirement protein A [Rhodococcus sp. IEGM 1379]MDI9915138.1 low temperature requirement protein A [Rhodococcus sp. IEGM 1379]